MRRRTSSSRSHYSRPYSNRRATTAARNRLLTTILIVLFLGYAFFTWILPTVVGGLTFLNRFKDNPAPQKPVSESPTLAPPVLNIPYEATNTATISIKGYSSPNTKVEIYIDNDLKTTTSTNSDGSFTSDSIPLLLGRNSISGKTVDDKNNKSFSSKPIQITYINEKPNLDLSQPQDNQTITGGDKKITVTGKVDQVDGITVTINGLRIIVGSDGNFSQTVDINEGDNTITVTATDIAGNTTQVARKVTYKSS